MLKRGDAEVDNVPVYTAVTVKNKSGWLKERIAKNKIDWLTFTSPSAVRGFFEQIEGSIVNSSNVKVASIGPVTAEQLKNLGVKVALTAAEHTIDGLLAAIEGTYK